MRSKRIAAGPSVYRVVWDSISGGGTALGTQQRTASTARGPALRGLSTSHSQALRVALRAAMACRSSACGAEQQGGEGGEEETQCLPLLRPGTAPARAPGAATLCARPLGATPPQTELTSQPLPWALTSSTSTLVTSTSSSRQSLVACRGGAAPRAAVRLPMACGWAGWWAPVRARRPPPSRRWRLRPLQEPCSG